VGRAGGSWQVAETLTGIHSSIYTIANRCEMPTTPQNDAAEDKAAPSHVNHLSLEGMHSTVEVPHHAAGFWRQWRCERRFCENTEGREMTNLKLQAALDELERLHDTVKGFKARNGTLPNPDSDAGRALFVLQTFTSELQKLNILNFNA
jgi:hypothetical protein